MYVCVLLTLLFFNVLSVWTESTKLQVSIIIQNIKMCQIEIFKLFLALPILYGMIK